MASNTSVVTNLQALQTAWNSNLNQLPNTPERIPAFFFGHGSPMLTRDPGNAENSFLNQDMVQWGGSKGPLATFLKEFGPALLEKYRPKGIVVFSAHWETSGERLVSDYGDENPLLYDYYGFQPELYELEFKSRGDSALSQRVVDLYKEAGQKARLSPKTETRGEDGRGFPGSGLDHGVFIPFRIMFGTSFTSIPIVAVSFDASQDPEKNWDLGKAVAKLREEGILVLSGGLTVHNLRDRASFSPHAARDVQREFDRAIVKAVGVKDAAERKQALVNLKLHPGFRAAHPREDHFTPIYVAAGAGDGGDAKLIADIYGCETIAFGL